MNRTELIIRITDASDGILTPDELRQLETDLQQYPDLMSDYKAIMKLPELDPVYPQAGQAHFTGRIAAIQNQIAAANRAPQGEPPVFYELSLLWFKKYALAASLLIVALTSVSTWLQSGEEYVDSAVMMDEFFYLADENEADAYVMYLDEFYF